MIKKVCVFGSYKDLKTEAKEETVRLGQMLAQNGITVMSGGFGGVMEDISRGAKSAGGKTVGVTYYLRGKAPYKKPNDFIDEEIVADSLAQRIDIMLGEADDFLVFPGGTGTMMELSTLLEYVNKGLMEPKPIVLFGRFWDPLVSCLKDEPVYSKKIRSEGKTVCCAELVKFAETSEECIRTLEKEKKG
jgi:uncharacterized protein (TIGR00730 family)